jgi:hypothetical protein
MELIYSKPVFLGAKLQEPKVARFMVPMIDLGRTVSAKGAILSLYDQSGGGAVEYVTDASNGQRRFEQNDFYLLPTERLHNNLSLQFLLHMIDGGE